MAIMRKLSINPFNGTLAPNTVFGNGGITIETTDNDVIISTIEGHNISLMGILARLDALETAYMESLMVGTADVEPTSKIEQEKEE